MQWLLAVGKSPTRIDYVLVGILIIATLAIVEDIGLFSK